MKAAPARSDALFLGIVLAAGIVLRLGWFALFYGDLSTWAGGGEAIRAALAVAREGTLADAYYKGYGPTAHVLPVMPVIAGGIMRVFGIDTPAGNLALLVWALLQTFVAYLLLARLFAALGMARKSVRLGLILLCLVPVFVPQETVDFRFWDGALAVCFSAASLLLIVRWSESDFSLARMAAAGLLSAATLFVSPAAGLGVIGCWALFALTRLPFATTLRFAVVGAIAVAAVLGPWALRNSQAVGAPVLLRSNFGLEFAIANHPAALGGDPAKAHAERMLEIHPFLSEAARRQLHAAGGEVAYSRQLADQTWAWAAANPGGFALLTTRHVGQFFFPRPWQMYFSGWEYWRDFRAWTISLIAFVGLIGLAVGLWRRRHGYAMLATYIVLAAAPYAIVQPVPRYSYLVFGLLVFLAVDALRSLAVKVPGTAR